VNGPPPVDLALLRTFREVVARRSMAEAAAELGYVPSAVSQQVSRLERAVGVQLLTRYPGEPVRPTAAGRQVAQAAGDMLAAAADFMSACQVVSQGTAELRVAVYATAACELLPGAIAALRRTDPAASVRLLQAEPDEGLPALVSGAVDLLIAYRYVGDDLMLSAHARETLLGREPMPLIRPAGCEPTELEWIAGLPGSPSRRLLEQWAASAGRPLRIRYETEDPHTVVSLTAERLGQGIVPVSVLRHRPGLAVEQAQLRVSGKPLTRQVLAVTRRRYTHPLTRSLCSSIRDALAET
jgi:DNA-binding transcriptional LysR family regulator